MNEERHKILDKLAQGKITVEKAEKLLAAGGETSPETRAAPGTDASGRRFWKCLRDQVEPGSNSEKCDRANIRVPFKLGRAGFRFAAYIPREAHDKINQAFKEKGMDVDLAQLRHRT